MRKFIVILLYCFIASCFMLHATYTNAQTPEFGSGQSAQPFFNIYNALFGMFTKINIPTPAVGTTIEIKFPTSSPAQPYGKTGLPSLGKPNVVFYCQGNTSWATQCDLAGAGCAPTSLAMILSSFGLTNYTPPVVDQMMISKGLHDCKGGNSDAEPLFTGDGFLPALGFTISGPLVIGGKLNLSAAKEYVDRGYLIFGSSNDFPLANPKVPGSRVGHLFVVDDVDVKTAMVDVRDPNNCSYAAGDDEDPSKRLKNVAAFSWKYAYALKKTGNPTGSGPNQ